LQDNEIRYFAVKQNKIKLSSYPQALLSAAEPDDPQDAVVAKQVHELTVTVVLVILM